MTLELYLKHQKQGIANKVYLTTNEKGGNPRLRGQSIYIIQVIIAKAICHRDYHCQWKRLKHLQGGSIKTKMELFKASEDLYDKVRCFRGESKRIWVKSSKKFGTN